MVISEEVIAKKVQDHFWRLPWIKGLFQWQMITYEYVVFKAQFKGCIRYIFS